MDTNDPQVAIKPLDKDTLAPPKPSRVGDAAAIRSRITEMLRDDRTRSENRRVMKGWFNGQARPYDQGMLDSLGQGDRTNFNPRQAKGMIESAKLPFYTLIFRSPRFLQVKCDYGYQPFRRAEWSEKISKYAHQMLQEWDDHDYNVQLYTKDMSTWGVGMTVWPDDENWQWDFVKINHFLVPGEASSNVKKWEELALFKAWNPVELYKLIENEESSKTMGWFTEAVKQALVNAAPTNMQTRPGFGDHWGEEYASSLRRGDVWWNRTQSQVRTWYYLVREFSGKITECIVLEDGSNGLDMNLDKEDSTLLFKRVDRYESFSQKVCPFPFDVGEGELHSVKGLGPDIFDNTMVKARLLCDTVDGARRSALMILEATEATAMQETQLVTINGATVISPGFKAIQNRMQSDMDGPIKVQRELDNTLQNATGQYQVRGASEDLGPDRTAREVTINAQQENALTESSSDRFCKRLDAQYYEVIRRAIKLGVPIHKRRHPDNDIEKADNTEVTEEGGKSGAYWFVRRCVEDDVPIEALDMKWICSVQATRGVGGGSQAAKDISTAGMMGMYPLASEQGKRHIARMRSMFLCGQADTDVVFPPFEEGDVPNDHEWAATMENNSAGNPLAILEVTPKQDPTIHFMTHFRYASQMVQAAQEGAISPIQALIVLHMLGPHMKEHLDQMVGDPTRKDELKQLSEAWLALSKVADQLQQQVDEAQQAKQKAQPQVSPEMIAAVIKAQGELKIKAFKTQGDMALKVKKQEQAMKLKDLAQAQKIEHANQDQVVKTIAALPAPGEIAGAGEAAAA